MPVTQFAANAHTVVATGWTSPANAYSTTNDSTYATIASSTKNVTLSGDFGFANISSASIPDNSTINSVKMIGTVGASAAVTGLTLGVQGRVSGANSGSEATSTATAMTTITATLSGVTLSDLRSASTVLKARVRYTRGNTTTSSTARLDRIYLEVDYTAPTFSADVLSWRFRNSNGDEAGASWLAGERLDIQRAADVDTRIRFETEEIGGASGAVGARSLEFRINGGAWTTLTTSSSGVRAVAAGLTNDGATTNQLTSGTGAFVAGRQSTDGSLTSGPTLGALEHTEDEFGFTLRSADGIVPGDSIEFQFVPSGGVMSAAFPNIAVTQGAPADAYGQEVWADSPVFWARLDETVGTSVEDYMGGTSGGYNGGYTLGTSPAAGMTGTAVTFDGTSGYVNFADRAQFDLGDGPFTLEAWVKRGANDATYHGIFDHGSGGYFFHIKPNNHGTFPSRLAFGKVAGSTVVGASTPITDTTTWHHVVLTRTTGGGTTLIYLDGTDVTVAGTAQTIVDTTSNLFIGQDVGNLQYFNGAIDEVAIYTTALSATRIQAHYDAGIASAPAADSAYPYTGGGYYDG